MADDPLASIDDDIRAACADRAEAWRALVVKDNQHNRDEYEAACTEVDGLLDLRHGLTTGALNVTVG